MPSFPADVISAHQAMASSELARVVQIGLAKRSISDEGSRFAPINPGRCRYVQIASYLTFHFMESAESFSSSVD